LLGRADQQRPRDYLYWEFNQNQAVRAGDWFAHRKSGGQFELYDLKTDPQQQNNVAPKHQKLVRTVDKWMDESHSPSDVWPSPGEAAKDFQTRLREAGVAPREANIDG
jgi:arylsulfatase A